MVRGRDGDVGRALLEIGTVGGADALGLQVGRIEPGHWADCLLYDLEHPSIAGANDEQLASALVFSGQRDVLKQVMIGGETR